MSNRISVSFNVNGRDVSVEIEPRRILADVIREECGLTGTHLGCEHGLCGACTVIVNGEPIRSCLMLGVQADGAQVETVESLATGDSLHPLQKAFIEHHALQCGFCTPGFLMLAAAVLRKRPDIADTELMDVLSSNLCRCTGYQNIKSAVRAAAVEMRAAAEKRTEAAR